MLTFSYSSRDCSLSPGFPCGRDGGGHQIARLERKQAVGTIAKTARSVDQADSDLSDAWTFGLFRTSLALVTCIAGFPIMQVMAEIVAKYGSKEKELSARLLKKYGRPLAQSVSAIELRKTLAQFGMEDQDCSGGGSSAAAAAPGPESDASRDTFRDPETPRPVAGSLDFRSKNFDALQVRRKIF